MISADELRRAALSLPEAEERETWGHPTFRVRDKLFATLADDGSQASVKATRQEQQALSPPTRRPSGSRPTSAVTAGSASGWPPPTRPRSASC
ncbi:MAG TPA: MmcQ/YjbR family DNA-binding protein [Actinomycetota bacterium]|nr:MmcQ/YjbR family DNA-binding protein [Actinomycetota bacterium]